MTEPRVVLPALVMGESVRRHEGSVWLADWGAGEVIRVPAGGAGEVIRVADGVNRVADGGPDEVTQAAGGRPEVVARLSGMPICFDWLPDGALLVVDNSAARLLRDGSPYADLGGSYPWNDITVDSRGNAFVNNIGYAFGVDEPAPGTLTVVTPDGVTRQVADDLHFPNGMTVLPVDTLIVAESHAARLTAFDIATDGTLRNRRVWANLPAAAPDGICIDDETGAIWYADVPNRQCVLVREGGETLRTVTFDRGAFDCVVADGQLYVAVADYTDPEMFTKRTGSLLAVRL